MSEQLDLFDVETTKSKIRLACELCDREDYDGITILPAGWSELENIGESLETGVWWNQMGICPECQGIEATTPFLK